MVRKKQSVGQSFKISHVAREAQKREIRFTRNIIGLLHLWFAAHPTAEGVQLVKTLAFQFNQNKEGHRKAHQSWLKKRHLGGDQALLA